MRNDFKGQSLRIMDYCEGKSLRFTLYVLKSQMTLSLIILITRIKA